MLGLCPFFVRFWFIEVLMLVAVFGLSAWGGVR